MLFNLDLNLCRLDGNFLSEVESLSIGRTGHKLGIDMLIGCLPMTEW